MVLFYIEVAKLFERPSYHNLITVYTECDSLQVTAEDCLQNSVASCSYESRNLVLYRGFIGAIDYLCGPNRQSMFLLLCLSLLQQ